jgi:hypothetical protein
MTDRQWITVLVTAVLVWLAGWIMSFTGVPH